MTRTQQAKHGQRVCLLYLQTGTIYPSKSVPVNTQTSNAHEIQSEKQKQPKIMNLKAKENEKNLKKL